jgi:hypothetical protein
MSATMTDIAEAVLTALNMSTLSQSFTATRSYVPVRKLEELSTLRVTVVASSLEMVLLDRSGRGQFDYVVDIGVQKNIGSGPMTEAQVVAACDPLMLLTEEIVDLFRFEALGSTGATCIEARNNPIFVPSHIDEKRVFTSVISLTFQVTRSRP